MELCYVFPWEMPLLKWPCTEFDTLGRYDKEFIYVYMLMYLGCSESNISNLFPWQIQKIQEAQ